MKVSTALPSLFANAKDFLIRNPLIGTSRFQRCHVVPQLTESNHFAIGGNATESLIGAGYSSTNATFGDGDDTILGGIASSIAKLIIKGTADPDSRFAAGKFTAAPKISTATITPSTDARFLIV